MSGRLMNKPNHEGQKILVVDDEKNYRIVLARLFEGAGYQAFLADSAGAAMILLQNEKISLVLTDLQMSGLNGLDFCQKVRGEFGEIPMIVFTADASGFGYDAMSNAGVRACLDKPFDNQVILTLVDDILLNKAAIPYSSGCEKNEGAPINENVFQKEPEIS